MSYSALIVDDSRLACKVMANMLDTFSIQSVAVHSAEQALDFLKYNKTDIIFLDHNMPGMDGLETIKVIKSNPLTATVPVMMYTAKSGEVYVSQARALGAVDVLPKGMEKDFLRDALEKLGLVNSGNSSKPASTNQTKVVAETEKAIEVPREDTEKQSVQSLWQNFWQSRAEPFLSHQRSLQSEELTQSTQKQTRFLVREIHQTLENFEHALAARMESHDDFEQAQQELTLRKQRQWLVASGVCFAAFFMVLLGFIFVLHDTNKELLITQQALNERQTTLVENLTNIEQKIASLEPAQARMLEPATQNIITLSNTKGDTVGELLPADNNQSIYQGSTNNGYYFELDRVGEIGYPLPERYYLTQNCQGDEFVNAKPATMFKNDNAEIFFVHKQAQPIDVNIGSVLDESGECTPLPDKLMSLYQLQYNDSLETGIDNNSELHLSSH